MFRAEAASPRPCSSPFRPRRGYGGKRKRGFCGLGGASVGRPEAERGDKTYWNRIGVAFRTKSGAGLNVTLTSLPVSGKMTLLVPDEKGDPAEAVAPGEA